MTNTQETYNKLEIPTKTLKNLEDIFKVADKFTLRQIAEYLKSYNYDLLNSLWILVMKWEPNEIDVKEIIYCKSWIDRNNHLIQLLLKHWKEVWKINRLTGEKII